MAKCGMLSGGLGGVAGILGLYVLWQVWSAYSDVSTKQQESITGNDKNAGSRNWTHMPNGFAIDSPAYAFVGSEMPKNDLSNCSAVFEGLTIRLVDWNLTDNLNPLDDFDGIDGDGKVPLTKLCKTNVIGSTFASYPAAASFSYPVCKNNCDKYQSGWGSDPTQFGTGNYGMDIKSTEAGVYVLGKITKDFVEDTWPRLMDTAGDHVKALYWSLPISIVLGIAACFTMESDQSSEQGVELNA